MSQNIIVTFALLYGACIALVCAVYVAIGMRKKRKQAEKDNVVVEE